MFPFMLFDFTGWWTYMLALQLVIGATIFMRRKSKKLAYKENPETLRQRYIEWEPKPLVEEDVIAEESPIMGKINENCLNVGATTFLNFDKEERIRDGAIKCLRKYGVGSCGPRGFYGTIDVHLELEERLAKFMEVEDTCVYSYGFCTVASAIPAYAKRGDIIFVDEKVCFGIQKGLDASRSTIKYFKHNNMEHLQQLLLEAERKKQINPKRRAFMVIEGIYINTGEMCPLAQVVELSRKFKLRIILDESLTIGVLGKNGRGITEYLNIPRDEIDLIIGSLEHSFASVGGFCAGSHFIVEHQRLSGLGYCFSASLPPLLTQAVITSLDILEENPNFLEELTKVSKKLNIALKKLKHFRLSGHPLSPIKHIYLKTGELTDRLKHTYLHNIASYSLGKGVAVSVAAYLRDVEVDCPEPSIRIASTRNLSDRDIEFVCVLLDEAYEVVGPKPDLVAVL